MAKSQTALDLKALQTYAVPEIRAQLGPETLVRRFTVLVPVEEVKKGRAPRRIATDDDLLQVQLRAEWRGSTHPMRVRRRRKPSNGRAG